MHRKQSEKRIRQQIEFEKNLEERPYLVSAFNLKLSVIDISKKFNLVKSNKGVDTTLRKLKSITKAGSNTLMIETKN